jgi:hypothetical protein
MNQTYHSAIMQGVWNNMVKDSNWYVYKDNKFLLFTGNDRNNYWLTIMRASS